MIPARIDLRLPPGLARLSRRERILIGAALATAIVVFLIMLWPASEPDSVGVELAATAPVVPAAPAYVATPAALPAASAVAAISLDGVMLKGVMGGGPRGGAAIFLLPNTGEQVVRVGRELVPGLRLRGIGVRHAILTGSGGDVRMDLNRAGATSLAATANTAPSFAAPASGAAPTQSEAMAYRLGLAPQRSGDRITGFAIRPGASLPLLERAGLQPGDVIVAVNGQAVESEEKILELPREIAGSYTAEFDYLRAGRRMKATLPVNPRPAQ